MRGHHEGNPQDDPQDRVCHARIPHVALTGWFTLGARVYGPGVRLADAQRGAGPATACPAPPPGPAPRSDNLRPETGFATPLASITGGADLVRAAAGDHVVNERFPAPRGSRRIGFASLFPRTLKTEETVPSHLGN